MQAGDVARSEGVFAMGTQTDSPRTPRADGVRNRTLLIDSARQAFAERGVESSLEDIARRAGVGIGTLYRHFPTRDSLVEAVYRREVETLCDAADEFLASLPADQALSAWMQRFVSYVATKRGMTSALKSMLSADATLFDDCRRQMNEAATRLLAAGVATGLVRADVSGADLLRAMG
ncbi:MAG: putative transcription regulator, partial [Acidimicrobiaceae bacterium]|nr:putative transcription regulator [Acidimicrobiaceae bacterium]